MKKIWILVLALVLAVILALLVFVPVGAGGQKPPTKQTLVISAPTEGYQGDTFVFAVKVVGLPKAKVNKVNYQIHIYKQAVNSAWIANLNGQGVRIKDAGNYYLITWTKAVKKNSKDTFAMFEVGIKLSDVNTGQVTLLEGIDGRNVSISLINIKVPRLEWLVEAPTLISVNTPFVLNLTAYNPSLQVLTFDIDTDFWHTCTDGSLFPSSYPVLAYNGNGDRWHIEFYWAGQVQPGQTVTWTFELKSGPYQCNSGLFELRDNLNSDKQLWLHNLQVVSQ